MDPISATAVATSMFADTAVGEGVAAGAATAADVTGAGLVSGIATPLAGFVGSGIADIGGASTVGSSIAGGLAEAESAIGGLSTAQMLNIGSSTFNALGSYLTSSGNAAAMKMKAQYERTNANNDMGAAERKMQLDDRDMLLAQSSAMARSAAGGGSTLDPSTVSILGNLETQGKTNELYDEWTGKNKAQEDMNQAYLDRFQANQYGTTGVIGAVGDLFKAGTLMDKYSSAFDGGTL